MLEKYFSRFLSFSFILLEALNVASAEDFSYLKACYPWFRPPEHKPEKNCTLRCSLHMPYLGVSGREAAICLGDGSTGIVCNTDKECQNIVDTSYCKQAFCLCEERGVERFYSFLTKSDSSVGFCTTLSEWHSGHVPLNILFPWKTFMIVFGTLVLTGLFLMAIKWASPLLNTLREEYRLQSSRDRGHNSVTDSAATQVPHSPTTNLHPRDKPPSYEVAVQLGDLPPSYELAQQQLHGGNSSTPNDGDLPQQPPPVDDTRINQPASDNSECPENLSASENHHANQSTVQSLTSDDNGASTALTHANTAAGPSN